MDDLERKIKIKNEYLQLIIDLGIDYDGREQTESLKALIDELVDLAKKALWNDDKSEMYFGDNKSYNILIEEIKG